MCQLLQDRPNIPPTWHRIGPIWLGHGPKRTVFLNPDLIFLRSGFKLTENKPKWWHFFAQNTPNIGSAEPSSDPTWAHQRPMTWFRIYTASNQVYQIHMPKMRRIAPTLVPFLGWCSCIRSSQASLPVKPRASRNSQGLTKDLEPFFQPKLEKDTKLRLFSFVACFDILRIFASNYSHKMMSIFEVVD